MDSVIVNYPDLSSKVKLQNLLNYYIDCINQVTSRLTNKTQQKEHLILCVKTLESEYEKNARLLGDGLLSTFKEFLDDSYQLINLLEAFSDPVSDHPVDILIAAKASHLQWLAVCLLEDLKIPLSAQR